MQFRIADTFTDSLARLTGDEQKAAKTTAFDLQMNLANPGHSFHKLDRAKDKNFWSVRVSRDIRLIVHKSANSLLLCYVDHHDKAYEWAERRKLEVHPTTGAAQFVVIRERVEQITVPRYVDAALSIAETPSRYVTSGSAEVSLFKDVTRETLLGYGVPGEWLADVQHATEDTILDLVANLPQEAGEALLELATGGRPKMALALATSDPFSHPDAQRRFRVMADVDELRAALEAPWDKWTIFLHPSQRDWVERDFAGPARVSGSAGTGKTIVAIHRAATLARKHPETRVLLTTFSDTLASQLHTRLRRLISNEPRLGERIDVASMQAIGAKLYGVHVGKLSLASDADIRNVLDAAVAAGPASKFSKAFLLNEWNDIVDAWQLRSWEDYRTVPRLGRKTRLSEGQRQVLWSLFDDMNRRLAAAGKITPAGMFGELAARLKTLKRAPYDFIVVDEAQDMSVGQLRCLAALGFGKPDALYFAGDLGQRIFQTPFSWLSLGVDIRGRSRTLRVNYRTSHQIRSHADRLLAQQLVDVDGNTEDRRGTVSVFNGPPPLIRSFDDMRAEEAGVATWLRERTEEGVAPHEIGIIVRSVEQIERARLATEAAGLRSTILDEAAQLAAGTASVLTMSLAKGLEFRAVVVMACDDDVVPLQSRLAGITDESDLEEVYNTERQLLYVACTRARDSLMVSSLSPGSEFLDDLAIGNRGSAP